MDLSGDHFVAEGIPITEFLIAPPLFLITCNWQTCVVKTSQVRYWPAQGQESLRQFPARCVAIPATIHHPRRTFA